MSTLAKALVEAVSASRAHQVERLRHLGLPLPEGAYPDLLEELPAGLQERPCYPGVPLLDLRPAQHWRPGGELLSGVQANAHICATYHAIDRYMVRYLGAPTLSSWLTFSKYAAREVGSWIRALEGLLQLLHPASGLGLPPHRLWRACVLTERVRGDRLLETLASAFLGFLGAAPRAQAPHRRLQWILHLLPELWQTAWAARNGLVGGNVELYHRLGLAFDHFLRAESAGRSGLEALQELTARGLLEDPLGYLQAGFSCYRQAHQVSLLERLPGRSRLQRQRLEEYRRQLVLQANLLLAIQEQSLVLQRSSLFGHPTLHALLGAVRPGRLWLTLAAPAHHGLLHFPLLPEGGNWADFETRMGFVDVTHTPRGPEEGFPVLFPEPAEQVRYYLPDPGRRGTILDLFTRYADGSPSELLHRGRPRPLRPLRGLPAPRGSSGQPRKHGAVERPQARQRRRRAARGVEVVSLVADEALAHPQVRGSRQGELRAHPRRKAQLPRGEEHLALGGHVPHLHLQPARPSQEAPVHLPKGLQAVHAPQRILEVDLLVVQGQEGAQRRLALAEEPLQRLLPALGQGGVHVSGTHGTLLFNLPPLISAWPSIHQAENP
jgi:hypothetical protein